MRIISIITLILSFCPFAHGQNTGISLSEYLKPKQDTLVYNCVYNSYHASGLHDTITLVYRKISVDSNTAYYIANVSDTFEFGLQLASFSGSAMIFKNDSIWLAPLTMGQSLSELTKKNFNHLLPPDLTFSKPFSLAKLKWKFVMEVFIKNYQFEDLAIGDTVLNKCLRLNLLVYDRSKRPDKATVWLSKDYGTVKWIRTTGRVEVLDLKLFRKDSN